MKKTLYLCILFFIHTASAQTQQMYRWTDSKGVVHYTEFAPDETREQILNFDTNNPPALPTQEDVKKLDKRRPTQALLVEIEEKKPVTSEDLQANSQNTTVASAQDPKYMTYCQIIHANLSSFDSLDRGDIDTLILVSQAGEQSNVPADSIQAQYQSTIDNLEKYCLQ